MQRMMAVDVVELAGFEAVEASTADEAILILESRSDIRIVFTDIDLLGDTNGMKLEGFIRMRWPPIDIILISGNRRPTPEDIPSRYVFFGEAIRQDSYNCFSCAICILDTVAMCALAFSPELRSPRAVLQVHYTV